MSIPRSRLLRICASGALLWATGCTSLREIPPADYATQSERKHVRVETREGLVYEFDFARVESDSLIGFRQRNVEGAFEEFVTVRLALDDVQRLSSRSVDWYRTGLVGGGVLAAVVAAGLGASSGNDDDGATGGGGKGGVE
jgi:hypothetical protein